MKLLKFFKFWHWPKKIWIPLLLIIIGALYFVFAPKQASEPVLTIKMQKGDVKELISSSGTLEGTDSADLRFKISGKLNYIGVKSGDFVNKGKLIASLDTQDLQINLQQARNSFEAKDSTAKRVEDDLHDQVSDEDYTEREERVNAQKARDSAYDDIKAAQRAFQDANIYAPLSGIVTKADPNAGQVVGPTDIIAQIVDNSQYVFEAEIDESDIGLVKSGQKASVTLNSYPDQTFEATVSDINPAIETTDSGATVVIVKLVLGKPEINFVSGLNGQADIITNEVSGVNTIPVEALMDADEVYIKKGDTYEKVKIETGLQSDTVVEVKSGLSPEDEVVTNPEDVKLPESNSFKFPGQS